MSKTNRAQARQNARTRVVEDQYMTYDFDALKKVGDRFVVQTPKAIASKRSVVAKIKMAAAAHGRKVRGPFHIVVDQTRSGAEVWRVQ